MTIDHDTFHAMEIDGLFEELDGPGASALNAHAASCETCGSRFERLRRARQRGLAALSEQVSDDFESRVMAAVDAAIAARASNVVVFPTRAPNLPSAAGGMPSAPSAKVVPIFARPWFAAAASLFLVIGAAAILSQKAMSKKDAAFTMSESAPAASMPAGQAPEPPAELAATATASPATPPVVVALDSPSPAASAAGPSAKTAGRSDDGALALNAPPPPRAARPMMKPSNADPNSPPAAAAAPPARAGGGASSTGNDITFAAAKQLYTAGRYREAQAKFEALQSGNPEAALYAARCVQHTSGCGAATSRFESLVTLYAGTSVGNRAAVDLSNCNAALGRSGPAATTAPNAKPAPRAPADVEPAPASADTAVK